MREYGLSDAVSSFSDYSSTINNLWGIYVVATFTAAGFGIALEDKFTISLAALVSIGFLAFTIGHLYLLLFATEIQLAIRRDIRVFLGKEEPDPAPDQETAPRAPMESGPFDKSILAICEHHSKRRPSYIAHIVIDACVLMIIWSMATGFDPLNLVAQ